jgi:hypothetical protein
VRTSQKTRSSALRVTAEANCTRMPLTEYGPTTEGTGTSRHGTLR